MLLQTTIGKLEKMPAKTTGLFSDRAFHGAPLLHNIRPNVPTGVEYRSVIPRRSATTASDARRCPCEPPQRNRKDARKNNKTPFEPSIPRRPTASQHPSERPNRCGILIRHPARVRQQTPPTPGNAPTNHHWETERMPAKTTGNFSSEPLCPEGSASLRASSMSIRRPYIAISFIAVIGFKEHRRHRLFFGKNPEDVSQVFRQRNESNAGFSALLSFESYRENPHLSVAVLHRHVSTDYFLGGRI